MMKTILVPTDFSKTAGNALDYAAEMALYTKAKIVLLHVCNNTPLSFESRLIIPSVMGVESDARFELEKEKKRIERNFGDNLISKIEFRWGFIIDEIIDYTDKNDVDILVMGMQGAGYIVERFLGSITTQLIKKCNVPVLTIGGNMSFRKIKKLVLATDGIKTNDEAVLKPLKQLVNIFKAHLYILHVAPALAIPMDIERSGFEDLADEMDGIDHSFHYHSSNEIVYDINAFADEVRADMIVMIPRKHSLLDGILTESDTKKMSFHTKIPLLSIHA